MMKRLISLACICCLILGFAIPCHAEESVTSPTLYYCIEDDHAIIVDFESPFALSLEIPAEIDGYPVTKIGPAAFSFCTELLEVTIPNTVTFIDDDAFVYCTELKKVHIPSTVTKLGRHIFTYSGMHQIHFLGDAPEFDEECFYDFTATAYYPAGNPTWTDEVMQNYWGNITWMPETAILKGDVTGDGRINLGDVSKLYASIKKTST